MFSMDYTGLEALYTDLKKLTDDMVDQIKKAKEIFEKVLEYYPNNYKIKTYLSIIELKDIENEEFEKYFQKACKVQSK